MPHILKLQLSLLLILFTACGTACQSTLPQNTKRIRDRYDAELAALKTKYEQDQLACDSAPNPPACKDQLSAAYRTQLSALWERENAEINKAVHTAIKGNPPNP